MIINYRLFNAYSSFETIGGAEKILISLYNGLKDNFQDSLILSFKRNEINKKYKLNKVVYFSLNFFLSLSSKDIIISHHRKITSLLIILKYLFRKKFVLIHVAHNEFYNFKLFTLFPEHIIAVSEKVKMNLIEYFNLDSKKITVIYNGINEFNKNNINENDEFVVDSTKINVLYPARVCSVKRQIEIVKFILNNHSLNNVVIYFAGDGPDLKELRSLTKHSNQFKVLGYCNINFIIQKMDYVLLFSLKEGLPISLIEACMHSKPLICNDVGGNLEILNSSNNGFVVNNFSDFLFVLNKLPFRNSFRYKKMAFFSYKVYKDKFCYNEMIVNYLNYIYSIIID